VAGADVGVDLPPPGQYATGLVFLPPASADRRAIKDLSALFAAAQQRLADYILEASAEEIVCVSAVTSPASAASSTKLARQPNQMWT